MAEALTCISFADLCSLTAEMKDRNSVFLLSTGEACNGDFLLLCFTSSIKSVLCPFKKVRNYYPNLNFEGDKSLKQ